MDWVQVLVMIVANLGIIIPMILWFRSESRADMREFSAEIRSWKNEINKEIKDFHGRLCAIEEGRK